jgi:Zn-dependent protease/CBS domain-containing protein
MGIAGAALFFASLIAHELSHSVVARSKGIPVDGITLFLFGGMAHTRMEAETPGDEFKIAGVGPVMSFAIAALLGAIWWFGVQLGWGVAVLEVVRYVAVLNIALAVFNLLPGFPLDGGRLFRAIVWKATGNATRATRVASTGGRWLGYALVALGLLSAFAGNVIGGMWLVFIGWFLRNAAKSSYQQHVLLNVLGGVRAGQAMTPDPDSVPAAATVHELMDEYLMRRRYSAYPVFDADRVTGIVTLQAIREVPREEWDRRSARDIMVPLSELVTVRPEDSLVTVLERLRGSPARRVLVMRGDAVLGLITPSDIAFWLDRARNQGRS